MSLRSLGVTLPGCCASNIYTGFAEEDSNKNTLYRASLVIMKEQDLDKVKKLDFLPEPLILDGLIIHAISPENYITRDKKLLLEKHLELQKRDGREPNEFKDEDRVVIPDQWSLNNYNTHLQIFVRNQKGERIDVWIKYIDKHHYNYGQKVQMFRQRSINGIYRIE